VGGADDEEGRVMILEIAQLQIKPGQTAAFEAAFAQAQAIIASMPGYLGHELQHCIEHDHQYMLLVRWNTLEDHTLGFRQSAQYQQWRTLLHHFYDPFPTVLHYSTAESK
jgi:heme-degrading monooxygenase HmoA